MLYKKYLIQLILFLVPINAFPMNKRAANHTGELSNDKGKDETSSENAFLNDEPGFEKRFLHFSGRQHTCGLGSYSNWCTGATAALSTGLASYRAAFKHLGKNTGSNAVAGILGSVVGFGGYWLYRQRCFNEVKNEIINHINFLTKFGVGILHNQTDCADSDERIQHAKRRFQNAATILMAHSHLLDLWFMHGNLENCKAPDITIGKRDKARGFIFSNIMQERHWQYREGFSRAYKQTLYELSVHRSPLRE